MSEQNLVEKIQAESDQILELLRNLVELESPSHRKDLVDQVGFMIAEHLGAQGLSPQVLSREEVGDLVWAEWGENEEGRRNGEVSNSPRCLAVLSRRVHGFNASPSFWGAKLDGGLARASR